MLIALAIVLINVQIWLTGIAVCLMSLMTNRFQIHGQIVNQMSQVELSWESPNHLLGYTVFRKRKNEWLYWPMGVVKTPFFTDEHPDGEENSYIVFASLRGVFGFRMSHVLEVNHRFIARKVSI